MFKRETIKKKRVISPIIKLPVHNILNYFNFKIYKMYRLINKHKFFANYVNFQINTNNCIQRSGILCGLCSLGVYEMPATIVYSEMESLKKAEF